MNIQGENNSIKYGYKSPLIQKSVLISLKNIFISNYARLRILNLHGGPEYIIKTHFNVHKPNSPILQKVYNALLIKFKQHTKIIKLMISLFLSWNKKYNFCSKYTNLKGHV